MAILVGQQPDGLEWSGEEARGKHKLGVWGSGVQGTCLGGSQGSPPTAQLSTGTLHSVSCHTQALGTTGGTQEGTQGQDSFLKMSDITSLHARPPLLRPGTGAPVRTGQQPVWGKSLMEQAFSTRGRIQRTGWCPSSRESGCDARRTICLSLQTGKSQETRSVAQVAESPAAGMSRVVCISPQTHQKDSASSPPTK